MRLQGLVMTLALGCAGTSDDDDKTDTDTDTDVTAETDETDESDPPTPTPTPVDSDTDTDTTPDPCDASGVVTGTNTGSVQDQDVIIALVDWDQDKVVLRNTGAAAVDLSAGDICSVPAYADFASFPGADAIAPGAEITLHLNADGTDSATDWYFGVGGFPIEPSDELGIYWDAVGHVANNIAAFVRFGDAQSPSRESETAGVSLWGAGDTLTGCSGTAILATGNIREAAGWTCVDSYDTCYP